MSTLSTFVTRLKAPSAQVAVPLLVLLILVMMLVPLPALADIGVDYKALWGSVREVVREPALRGALVTVLTTATLCTPLITFCPVLVKEVFRSGVTYRRGAGNVFYFRPGHETYPIFKQELPLKIVANAVNWLGTHSNKQQ